MKNYHESKKTYSATFRGDEVEAVEFLYSYVGKGRALELGIGTGRIAIPLQNKGADVHGIDISPSTVAIMKRQLRNEKIPVHIGDMAEVSIDGKFNLIYVIWNTFYNLPSQEIQLKCFRNVKKHLTTNGVFVIEAYMPTFLYKLDNNQYVRTEYVQVNKVGIDVLMHDPTKQMIEESHLYISNKGIQMCPVVQRYAWPCELDLMAQLAGMSTFERWGNWTKQPFRKDSEMHISVFKNEKSR
jgi:SAM-dependent methyltransferase